MTGDRVMMTWEKTIVFNEHQFYSRHYGAGIGFPGNLSYVTYALSIYFKDKILAQVSDSTKSLGKEVQIARTQIGNQKKNECNLIFHDRWITKTLETFRSEYYAKLLERAGRQAINKLLGMLEQPEPGMTGSVLTHARVRANDRGVRV